MIKNNNNTLATVLQNQRPKDPTWRFSQARTARQGQNVMSPKSSSQARQLGKEESSGVEPGNKITKY